MLRNSGLGLVVSFLVYTVNGNADEMYCGITNGKRMLTEELYTNVIQKLSFLHLFAYLFRKDVLSFFKIN